MTWLLSTVEFAAVAGDEAVTRLGELGELYADVYADPPYEWGQEHTDLFAQRFKIQRRRPGFRMIEARDAGRLVGIGFGFTLATDTLWWQDLLSPIDAEVASEYPNRTFAVIELLVRAPWRRRHVAEEIHDRLLADRVEERATLTTLPAAEAAQAAYRKWGWRRVARKRNPLPESPVFDVMLKGLR